MAKTPKNAKTPSKSPLTPADIAGADIGGESPQKASPIPADAPLTTSFAEPQGNGGETHQTAGGDDASQYRLISPSAPRSQGVCELRQRRRHQRSRPTKPTD